MKYLEKLKDYNEWKKKNEDFSFFDYLPIKLTIEQLLLASQLFLPEISIEENCVFIKQSRQYKFLHKYKNQFKEKSSLEKYINCFFLECIFQCETDNDKQNVKMLAEVIKTAWEAYFYKNYPEFQMRVEIYEDEFDGWCITCFTNIS